MTAPPTSAPDGARVQLVDGPAGRVLVKRQRPERSPLGYRVLDGVTGLLGLGALRAVPPRGGAHAQATEARRLRELHAADAPVPRLLAEAPDHLTIEYIEGPSLSEFVQRCTRDHPQDAMSAWLAGARALADLHASGQYLSQAFMRNMLWHDGRVWFIDFEDDPLEVMTLEQAQARDWLAYLHSSVWSLGLPASELLQHWREVLDREAPPVLAELSHSARRLAWLRHLPHRSRKWGRDVLRTRHVATFLHAWTIGITLLSLDA